MLDLLEEKAITSIASEHTFFSCSRRSPGVPTTEELTDMGNAHRFIAAYGHCVRYVPSWGWLLFDNRRWYRAEFDQVLGLAHDCLMALLDGLPETAEGKYPSSYLVYAHLVRSQSVPRLKALLHLARTLPGVSLSPTEFDADPYLLNMQNGTVDLRTGELRPHKAEDYITHLIPYDYAPQACSSAWQDFLSLLTNFDADLQCFLQRAIGSSLFGSSGEMTAFVLTGSGQRAHQLLLSTLRQLFGDYASHSLTLWKRDLTPSLLTSRVLTLASPAFPSGCSATVFSALLNGDPIALPRSSASPEVWYQPRTTVWLSCTEIPTLSPRLDTLACQLQPIPLTFSLSAYEAYQLSLQFQEALPAILNWAIQGFQLWLTSTSQKIATVEAATASFHEDQNELLAFLDQCCVQNTSGTVSSHVLYEGYTMWTRAVGEHRLSLKKFSKRLAALGIIGFRQKGGYYYSGVTLRTSDLFSAQVKSEKQEPSHKGIPEQVVSAQPVGS